MTILGSIQAQLGAIDRSTQKVANVGARAAQGQPVGAKDAIDLITAERSFQASLKALKAGDEATGILIDVKA